MPFDSALRVSARVKAEAFERGLLVYPGSGTVDGRQGDHVLLAPPYSVTDAEVDVVPFAGAPGVEVLWFLARRMAALLSERGISGAPVVDAAGEMIGIVSEGDLLHRAEIGTARRHRERRRSWWLDHFAAELARDYVKSHGRTVKDIMTRDVVTVTEDTDLGEVAALLEAKRIKRVPVTRDGKVIGIISRANLVRALAATKGAPPREGEDDDRMIRARLVAELSREEWAKVWPDG